VTERDDTPGRGTVMLCLDAEDQLTGFGIRLGAIGDGAGIIKVNLSGTLPERNTPVTDAKFVYLSQGSSRDFLQQVVAIAKAYARAADGGRVTVMVSSETASEAPLGATAAPLVPWENEEST
jgi:hypothetical protein